MEKGHDRAGVPDFKFGGEKGTVYSETQMKKEESL